MDKPQTSIAVASEADASELTAVKPGYGVTDVAERFRWLAQDVDATWFLLKQNSEVIGWCVASWSGKKTHPEHPDLQDLFVKAEYRNQGCGSRLVAEVERIARNRGHTRLGIAVNPDDNQGARRLYERLGFRHDGRPKYLDGIYGDFEDWVIDLEKGL
ncbi:MAG: GNAT family N-acetyltransferase [Victivallales bacterium]|jgi:GNAT superfamily N-acetyltransferase|nr:GNAT family N-acetyltransferase [Victivallales bacterium]